MKRILCVALLLAALLSGCGNLTKAKSAADVQVAVFHQQLNNNESKAIVSAADSQLFDTWSRAETTDFLTVVHKKLGNVMNSQNTRWHIRMFNGETIVVLLQDTEFKKGYGRETFAFRVEGDKARLAGYSINSRDLTMKRDGF